MDDFFISYNQADKHWAQGIGDWLDHAGFSTILQATDFVAGSNFVSEMHNAVEDARRVILVLSPDYLKAQFPQAEWTAVFAKDPTNQNRTIIPVRVRECEPGGLLRPITYIDLVGLRVEQAREKFIAEILAMLQRKRPVGRAIESVPAPPPPARKSTHPKVSQTAIGSGITQVAGNQFIYNKPPKKEVVLKPRDGAVSAEQAYQIQQWIEKLVEGTLGKSRTEAFKMWHKRLKNKFKVDKYQEIQANDFVKVEAWFLQQSGINTRKLKTKDPNAWRKARYKSIHIAMGRMDVNKLSYYEELSIRLKMKNPFLSLTDLTKQDLERVYTMVLRDAKDRGKGV